MKYVNPEAFINNEIGVKSQKKLLKAISDAYKDSVRIIEKHESLNWLGGKEILPYIRRALIEYEIMKLCENNLLPYDYRMSPNKIDNCHHLELRTENCILTISHINRREALPRKAIFRKNLNIFNNQISLWDEEYELDGPYHLILTHGVKGKHPEFIYIGMPDCNERKWIANIDITNQGLSVIDNDSDIVSINDDLGLTVKVEYLKKQGVLKNEK